MKSSFAKYELIYEIFGQDGLGIYLLYTPSDRTFPSLINFVSCKGEIKLKEKNSISLLSAGLVWFCASVSVSGIFTGISSASLGTTQSAFSILIGNLIAALLIFFAAKTQSSGGRDISDLQSYSQIGSAASFENPILSVFGPHGAVFFAALNILLLIVRLWLTLAQSSIFVIFFCDFTDDRKSAILLCLICGIFILLCAVIEMKYPLSIFVFAAPILILLCSILSITISGWHGGLSAAEYQTGFFRTAAGYRTGFFRTAEQIAYVSLFWLYPIFGLSSKSASPKASAGISAAAFFIGSCWTNFIGTGILSSFEQISRSSPTSVSGLTTAVVLFTAVSAAASSIPTAYSAKMSSSVICDKIDRKKVSATVLAAGILLALCFPSFGRPFAFYRFSGSVLVPMGVIWIADAFLARLFKIKFMILEDDTRQTLNFSLWLFGFLLSLIFHSSGLQAGSILPVIPALLAAWVITHCTAAHFLRRTASDQGKGAEQQLTEIEANQPVHTVKNHINELILHLKKESNMNTIRQKLRLYAVTDSSHLFGHTLPEAVEESIRGGVTMVQLREKHMEDEELLHLAKEIKQITDKYAVPLIINDRPDIAFLCGASGVHIGQEDGSIKEARRILGDEKIIGVSAHNVLEAKEAENKGADYLGVGAVFPTSTKENTVSVTPEMLIDIQNAVNIPTVAIGGITSEKISALRNTGIDGVAVVSAIFSEENPKAAAERISAALDKAEIGLPPKNIFAGRRISGAIFDVDGTILDSMPMWCSVSSRFLEKNGVTPEEGIDRQMVSRTLEESAAIFSETYGIPGTVSEIVAGMIDMVREDYKYHLTCKPGVQKVIQELSEKRIPLYIATATDREMIIAALSRLDLLQYFQGIITCGELGVPKTQPDIYIYAAKKLGTKPEETLVFEDVAHAVRAASQANFPVVAIYDDNSAAEKEAMKAMSTLYLETYSDWPCIPQSTIERNDL